MSIYYDQIAFNKFGDVMKVYFSNLRALGYFLKWLFLLSSFNSYIYFRCYNKEPIFKIYPQQLHGHVLSPAYDSAMGSSVTSSVLSLIFMSQAFVLSRLYFNCVPRVIFEVKIIVFKTLKLYFNPKDMLTLFIFVER